MRPLGFGPNAFNIVIHIGGASLGSAGCHPDHPMPTHVKEGMLVSIPKIVIFYRYTQITIGIPLRRQL